MSLKGKTAIVSAAGRGIGKGVAIALAKAGADVVANSWGQDTTAPTPARTGNAASRLAKAYESYPPPPIRLEQNDE